MTRIHPVLHIPKMSTQLLSMGEFLRQGMRVEGDLQQVSLLNKNQLFIQCKPLFNGQTLFWLDVTSTTVDAQPMEKPIVYKCHALDSSFPFLSFPPPLTRTIISSPTS